MRSLKMYAFFLMLSMSGIVHSMPAPYEDKEKAEEYVPDCQGTTKEQGQRTTTK